MQGHFNKTYLVPVWPRRTDLPPEPLQQRKPHPSAQILDEFGDLNTRKQRGAFTPRKKSSWGNRERL